MRQLRHRQLACWKCCAAVATRSGLEWRTVHPAGAIPRQSRGCGIRASRARLAMNAKTQTKRTKLQSQRERFKALAREVGADESEAALDKALGKIGRALPQPKPKRKKRKPLKLAL